MLFCAQLWPWKVRILIVKIVKLQQLHHNVWKQLQLLRFGSLSSLLQSIWYCFYAAIFRVQLWVEGGALFFCLSTLTTDSFFLFHFRCWSISSFAMMVFETIAKKISWTVCRVTFLVKQPQNWMFLWNAYICDWNDKGIGCFLAASVVRKKQMWTLQ